MFGGLLTKLAQTPSIRIDVVQGPLDGIHELLVQREGVGFNSSLVGVVDVPLDGALHFSREDTMVGTSVNLHATRDWLAHEALVPRDSHCCKGKEVVVLPAECPEGRRPNISSQPSGRVGRGLGARHPVLLSEQCFSPYLPGAGHLSQQASVDFEQTSSIDHHRDAEHPSRRPP